MFSANQGLRNFFTHQKMKPSRSSFSQSTRSNSLLDKQHTKQSKHTKNPQTQETPNTPKTPHPLYLPRVFSCKTRSAFQSASFHCTLLRFNCPIYLWLEDIQCIYVVFLECRTYFCPFCLFFPVVPLCLDIMVPSASTAPIQKPSLKTATSR